MGLLVFSAEGGRAVVSGREDRVKVVGVTLGRAFGVGAGGAVRRRLTEGLVRAARSPAWTASGVGGLLGDEETAARAPARPEVENGTSGSSGASTGASPSVSGGTQRAATNGGQGVDDAFGLLCVADGGGRESLLTLGLDGGLDGLQSLAAGAEALGGGRGRGRRRRAAQGPRGMEGRRWA